jgi:hypothetical protein
LKEAHPRRVIVQLGPGASHLAQFPLRSHTMGRGKRAHASAGNRSEASSQADCKWNFTATNNSTLPKATGRKSFVVLKIGQGEKWNAYLDRQQRAPLKSYEFILEPAGRKGMKSFCTPKCLGMKNRPDREKPRKPPKRNTMALSHFHQDAFHFKKSQTLEEYRGRLKTN